jgi:Holliday junction resolvase-like predicted endonuclease
MLDKFEQTLVFVEVHYQQNTQFGLATDTINLQQSTKAYSHHTTLSSTAFTLSRISLSV